MAYVIENKTRTTILLRLRSGVVFHLGPGETSPPLEEADVVGNDRVEGLGRRGLVTMAPAPKGAGKERSGKAPGRPAGTKRRGERNPRPSRSTSGRGR
jgi:hypothetical protein